MLFPTAGIEANPLLPPAIAFVVSFFMSMGGVSGAFLLLPFQMSFLGYVTPSVSATNHLYNVVSIPSGVYRFVKEQRMVWPLALVVVLATLPGVLIGALIRIHWLPSSASFKPFAGIVLFYIGARLAMDIISGKTGGKAKSEEAFQNLVRSFRQRNSQETTGAKSFPVVRVLRSDLKKIEYEFYGEKFSFPTGPVFAMSFIVGIVGGTYGIGGGAIMAPFFVSFFGLPVHTVAGAALMGTFVTSLAGVGFYMLISPYYPELSIRPDWSLGLLFGLGGMVGMYCGARMQKFVPARLLKILLTVVILGTSLNYIHVFFY